MQLSAALRGLLPIQTKAKPLMGGQRLRLCRVRHWLGLRYKTGSLLGPWALTSARGALGGPGLADGAGFMPAKWSRRVVSLVFSLDVSGSRRLPVQAASNEAPEHMSETQRVLFLFLPSETYGT